MSIKEDLRLMINEVLDRLDAIKDPLIRNTAILGVAGTLQDLLDTINKETKQQGNK